MKMTTQILFVGAVGFGFFLGPLHASQPPTRAQYRLAGGMKPSESTVESFELALGPFEQQTGGSNRWFRLQATKVNGARFRLWILGPEYPPETLGEARQKTARYVLQEGDSQPVECRDRLSGKAVLPSLGGWVDLIPRGPKTTSVSTESLPEGVRYLGHSYHRQTLVEEAESLSPPEPRVMELMPNVLVGLASNTRQKDQTRRYDGSDYEYVRLTRDDYRQVAQAGINCVNVNAEQLPWVTDLDVFYWGPGGAGIPFPECLYRSQYLGGEIWLDEPAVCTRDQVIRPKLAKDPAFRKTITCDQVFQAFRQYFGDAIKSGVGWHLIEGLKARPDVDLADMRFAQENLYTWDSFVSSAAYQLSQDPRVPSAMVFEPPGRIGTLRTLPELDMTYGCQIAVDDPSHLTAILYGFLRGAARLTDKEWGTSIYGSVEQADAPEWLRRAYDQGATRFFFWDNAVSACVPYQECLALAHGLRTHVESHPTRDLRRLKHAAEVAILLPPGYNLGHVQMGKGSLWGLGELNLERHNSKGLPYRVVMANFFLEVERCIRSGVPFDLLWDLPAVRLEGYREVVRVREDGKVQVETAGKRTLFSHGRVPARPEGPAPVLNVSVSETKGRVPLAITALADVSPTSTPVYYTMGADSKGVYHNAVVAWELYGPNDEDYRSLQAPGLRPVVEQSGAAYKVTTRFRLDRPGHYRLRASTVDLAGRSRVVWVPIEATE